MEFTEILMSVEMNSFIEFYSDDDDKVYENEDFKKLRQALDVNLNICNIHELYYSNGRVGFNGSIQVYFSDQRKDIFIILDLASEADGLDQVNLLLRYPRELNSKVKHLSRTFYDRTKNDCFYQEGVTIERNSKVYTDLTKYPKLKKISGIEYFQNLEFYQNGKELHSKIDLTEIYSWPFTKQK
jgi:hypothetical protein